MAGRHSFSGPPVWKACDLLHWRFGLTGVWKLCCLVGNLV
jgi:hypothetical protein